MEAVQPDPMKQYSLQFLRKLCDEYDDGSGCRSRAWVTETEFTDFLMEALSNAAKLALNVYNQKEQKNFKLEKVCKLNHIVRCFYMTFTAKNAETDECHPFRGVVDSLSDTVYLCEIKEPIDFDSLSHCVANNVEASSESKEDHSPST